MRSRTLLSTYPSAETTAYLSRADSHSLRANRMSNEVNEEWLKPPGQQAKGRPRINRLSTILNRGQGFPSLKPYRMGDATTSALARFSQRANLNPRLWQFSTWNFRGSRHEPEEETIAHFERSRLLFAELFLVAPSVVSISAYFRFDESERRVPVLLDQFALKVEPYLNDGINSVRISCEYGSRPLLRWTLIRDYRELKRLHYHIVKRGVLHRKAQKPPHLPHPKDYPDGGDDSTDTEGSSDESLDSRSLIPSLSAASHLPQDSYTSAVQFYLSQLLHQFRLRQDSNRLLTFFEISNMTIKLAAEYPLHGKEGLVYVRSSASSQGWRVRHWTPTDVQSMITRHLGKWMVIRESFIVLVDDISATNLLDVFFIDSGFEIVGLDTPRDTTNIEGCARHKGGFLHLRNNSRSLKLATRRRDLKRWVESLREMKQRTPWAREHRFGSYAPVRHNVATQWFVDARDYMWSLSEVLESARDTIYFLDWWLSPELYLRRPPEGNQKWRLDRILLRKAEQGVKIFIVVYRNVGSTIPIDSAWTKYSMLDLHPNIHILRSPNQFLQKEAMFWAHHEKVCVVDNAVGFCGGVDLCFGRWDTPQHVLVDDAPVAFHRESSTAQDHSEDPKSDEHTPTQTWPGKDYSNPRVKDFFELDRPYDNMYNRRITPRMPWHDIHQMVLGEPARDLARHFVQRWNYIIRQKIPSRQTPLLIPPPDFTPEELARLKLTGTSEYQVLRSGSNWSMGLQEHEQSIQNAYLTLIDTSEHFVYIENQFFITSTVVDGIVIENQIGNALVQRIIRAHNAGEKWRAIILIPLMPGFEAEINTTDAASVRVISQCQFNSISRGSNSIFYKLESAGIHPEDHISFFSLRKWGKIGADKHVVTEQLYIHCKTLIVDDRTVIIGSANINERSMRGVRDSEVAVCVRDTEVIQTTMDGKPFEASKYAYTLRKRLMREHLGVDVDKVEYIEQIAESFTPPPIPGEEEDPEAENDKDAEEEQKWLYPETHSFNWYAGTSINAGLSSKKKISQDRRIQSNETHRKDVLGKGFDQGSKRSNHVYRTPLEQNLQPEAEKIYKELMEDESIESMRDFMTRFYQKWTHYNPAKCVAPGEPLVMPIVDESSEVTCNQSIYVDPWEFDDPCSDEFYQDKWLAIAERNTDVFRMVFHCQPDNDVTTWKDYRKAAHHMDRLKNYQSEQEEKFKSKQRRKYQHLNNKRSATSESQVDSGVGKVETQENGITPQKQSNVTDLDAKHVDKESTEPGTPASAKLSESTSSSCDCKSEYQSANEEDTDKKDTEERGFFSVPAPSSAAGIPGIPSVSQMLGFPNQKPYKQAGEANGDVTRKFDQSDQRGLHPDGCKADPEGAHVDHADNSNGGLQFATCNTKDDSDKYRRQSSVKPYISETPDSSEIDDSHKGYSSQNSSATSYMRAKRSETVDSQGTYAHPRRRGHMSRRMRHFYQIYEKDTSEEILAAVTGHVVLFPTEWLSNELESGNWNFQMDRVPPLEIFN